MGVLDEACYPQFEIAQIRPSKVRLSAAAGHAHLIIANDSTPDLRDLTYFTVRRGLRAIPPRHAAISASSSNGAMPESGSGRDAPSWSAQ
jgi:hypothetical protein